MFRTCFFSLIGRHSHTKNHSMESTSGRISSSSVLGESLCQFWWQDQDALLSEAASSSLRAVEDGTLEAPRRCEVCVTRHMGDVRMYNILDLSRSNYVKFQDLLVDLHI